jgi:hypothetical protein
VIKNGTQKLSVLIQILAIAEKTAEAARVPFLKGAIGTALAIAECAQVSNRGNIFCYGALIKTRVINPTMSHCTSSH